jgi:hypothetical protein
LWQAVAAVDSNMLAQAEQVACVAQLQQQAAAVLLSLH